MNEATIALVGSAGDLGGRIARALVRRGARVRALVRNDRSMEERLRQGIDEVEPVKVDFGSTKDMAKRLEGAQCVISAWNGLRPVIIDRQARLLEAAVEAGVPRFIPSDFSLDFTRTTPGLNRNLDLRREFMARVDASPIRATSILNGALMDMIGEEVPLVQPSIRRVLYWGNADQPLDWTTKDDVASYTAAAAMDADAPRLLRIAGETVSARQIAELLAAISGRSYRPMSAGSIGLLGAMIALTRRLAPGADAPFPAWQGMQYMRDMFSGAGRLRALDNDRYPGIVFTKLEDYLKAKRRW